MKQIRPYICFLLLAFANASHAQSMTAPDPKFFKNFTGIVSLLRANGVEASMLQWNAIENACSAYDNINDTINYNHCRYTKARDQAYAAADARGCNDQAFSQYPDTLMTPNSTNVVRYINGISSTTSIQNQPVSQSDLNGMRDGAYAKCMITRGWRDPHNYLMGNANAN